MADASSITALLGPTNTGKTHRTIERMLDHDTGMIGLPLRLLAREVYDRVSVRVGEGRVALVTGEEKRVPRRPDVLGVHGRGDARWTREVDFLAVDEVQLAAHAQRGHVFTERVLHARGRRETWFMGSDTMRGVMEQLCPAAKVVSHPRLSRLSYAEPVPLQRLPPRSAVVAFSLPQVYELAERLRIARGGSAVVLGALSPRTRNAQVAIYQKRARWTHLVATDAIGMGLNLDVRHVAFASLRKFDGREVRDVDVAELAQIAGRAGRHVRDGTFGAVAPLSLPRDVARAIEGHRFPAVRRVQWRSADLAFDSLDALLASLQAPPPMRCLRRVATPDDEAALAILAALPAVRARASDPARVRLLWEVCSVPDFRKLLREAHAELLGEVFVALADRGALAEPWLRARVAELDDPSGDVDALVARIAAVRTYTYVASQPAWVERAEHWQEQTRAVEDRLSDALHAALVRRFVDQPNAAPRAAAPRARRRVGAEAVEVAPTHPFAALRPLRDAMRPRVERPADAARARVDALVEAPHERFSLGDDGTLRARRRSPRAARRGQRRHPARRGAPARGGLRRGRPVAPPAAPRGLDARPRDRAPRPPARRRGDRQRARRPLPPGAGPRRGPDPGGRRHRRGPLRGGARRPRGPRRQLRRVGDLRPRAPHAGGRRAARRARGGPPRRPPLAPAHRGDDVGPRGAGRAAGAVRGDGLPPLRGLRGEGRRRRARPRGAPGGGGGHRGAARPLARAPAARTRGRSSRPRHSKAAAQKRRWPIVMWQIKANNGASWVHSSRAPPGRFERDVAALLIEVFQPRMDLLACRIDDAETAARLTAWERERFGARGRVWRVGDWRPAGCARASAGDG